MNPLLQAKPPLQKRFSSEESLIETEAPEIRLGGLYHLLRKGATSQVKSVLERLIQENPPSRALKEEDSALLFTLHAAIGLSQKGSVSGLQWLLNFLILATTPHHKTLGTTALRNCGQFPFAVLLGNSVGPNNSEQVYNDASNLVQWSDDMIWQLAEGSTKEDEKKRVDFIGNISTVLSALPTWTDLQNKIGLGTVLTRPLRHSEHFRYSGFIGLETEEGTLRGIPYTMAEVINTATGAARQAPYELMQPGRQVCVTYRTQGDHEAVAVYAIPLYKPSIDVAQNLLRRMALGSEGVEISVVAHHYERNSVTYVRTVTSQGHTESRRSRPEEILGKCSFVHPANADRLFENRKPPYHFGSDTVEAVLRLFLKNTSLARSTLLSAWKTGYKVALADGTTRTFGGNVPDQSSPLLLLETTRYGLFSVALPVPVGTHDEREHILTLFSNNTTLQRSTLLAPDKDGSYLALQDGTRIRVANRIPVSGSPIILLETSNEGVSPVKLPIPVGTQEERIQIFRNYFAKHPEEMGVVLDMHLPPRGNAIALVVNGKKGEHTFWEIREEAVQIGALVFWNEAPRRTLTFLKDIKMEARCKKCFDTKICLCTTCLGQGRKPCPQCNGSLKTPCGHCQNGHLKCSKCSGSGRCTTCNGAGMYADTKRICVKCGTAETLTPGHGRCDKCSGNGQFECRTCKGTGHWDCDVCHKTGSTSCPPVTPCGCNGIAGSTRPNEPSLGQW